MPRVPITTINLLRGCNIPENDAHQFICSHCGYCANHSRNKWIQHMYDFHSPVLESILDGIRAVNRAVQQIDDNEIDNENAFHILEENELIEEQDHTNNFEQQLKDVFQAVKNGILNEAQFLDEIKKLHEKKN